jgi:hypothetical protein
MEAQSESDFLIGQEMCAVVLGKGAEFVLLDVNKAMDSAVTEAALAKNYKFCGLLAVKNGQAGARCEGPDCIETMLAASLVFARVVSDSLQHQHQHRGDGVEWLTKLYALPDTRN